MNFNFLFSKNGKIISELLDNVDEWTIYRFRYERKLDIRFRLKHVSGLYASFSRRYNRDSNLSFTETIEWYYIDRNDETQKIKLRFMERNNILYKFNKVCGRLLTEEQQSILHSTDPETFVEFITHWKQHR